MNDWKQLIIPLVILTLWGLKQVFEQEPQKPAVRPTPPGPRPDLPLPGQRAAEGRGARDPSFRWPEPASSGRRADDDVIVIRSDAILPEPGRPGASRRPAPRPGKGPSRWAEPDRARPLTTGVTQGVGQSLGQRLGLGAVTLTQAAAPAPPPVSRPSSPTPARTTAIVQALRSPERVREAFIVNELLQPPLALRRPRRG